MKAKVTANQLADLLAEASDTDRETALGFIKSLFAEITAQLESGKAAKIKGFGEFTPEGDFIPDPAFADEVNAPFAAFEPVELAEGVTEEMLLTESLAEPDTVHAEPELEPVKASENAMIEPQPEAPANPEPEAELLADEPVNEDVSNSEEAVTEPVVDSPVDTEPITDDRRIRIPLWLVAVIFTAVGFVAGYFVTILFETKTEPAVVIEEETVTIEPQLIETPDIEADSKTENLNSGNTVTDTVRQGYYFTTMARRHYGDKAFWVYIYEANAAEKGFSHPERVVPGTVVRIPAPEDYGIDPDNPESVEAAKRKAYEIYSRYQ